MLSMRRRAWVLTSLCIITACTSGAADGDTGEAMLEDLRACDAPKVCGSVSSTCGEDLQPCPFGEAEVCTLEGLRDGTPGHYAQIDCEGGCYGQLVLLGAGGSVLLQDYFEDIDGETLGSITLCSLRPDADYFQSCLDDPAAMPASCLTPSNWVVDCSPLDSPTCAAVE